MAVVSRTKPGTNRKEWRALVSYKKDDGSFSNKSSKWLPTKKEAQEAEAKIKATMTRLTMPRTFGEICREWIESDPGAPRTKSDKLQILNTYLKPIAGNSLDDITPPVLKRLFSLTDLDHLSTSRKNRVRGIVSSTFKYAMAMYEYDRNPVDGIPTFKQTTEERLKQKTVYTVQEFKLMLSKIPPEHQEYANCLTMLYLTGMRMNECLSLTFDDFDGSRVHVWRQYSPYSKQWEVLKTENSERWISLDKTCRRIIEEQRKEWLSLPGSASSWFIFGGLRQLSTTTLHRVMNAAQEAAGLPHSRLHDLRHAHASMLLENMKGEGDILKVSKRLGHSSVTTTLEIYAHVLKKDEDDIISVLEAEF